MGLFNRGGEKVPTLNELNEANEGSIDQALDKGEDINKLLELYQKVHGERITPEKDEYKFSQLLQIKERINTVSKRARGFLSKEFGEDLGMKFSQEDFDGVTEYLEREAVKKVEEWPRFLAKFEEQLDRYEELQHDVKEAERILKESTKNFQEREGAYDNVKAIDGFKRWTGAFLSPKQRKVVGQAKEVGIGKSTVLAEHYLYHEGKDLKKFKFNRDNIKQEHDNLRRTILRTLLADKSVADQAIDAFHERLRKTVSESSQATSAELNQTQTAFDKADSKWSAVDYFDGMDRREKEALKRDLNEAIQNKITYEMRTAIDSFELGNKQLSKMEKILGEFLSREEVGQIKNKENNPQAKMFILETLKAIYDKLERENPADVRLTLIERVIVRSKVDLKFFRKLGPGRDFKERVNWEPPKEEPPAEETPEVQPDATVVAEDQPQIVEPEPQVDAGTPPSPPDDNSGIGSGY